MHQQFLIAFGYTVIMAITANAEEDSWGNLHGRFVYDGMPPKPQMHEIRKDTQAFADRIADESLVVNAKNQGIANIIVFLLPDRQNPPRVHPSYDRTANAKLQLRMVAGRFDPHVLLLRTGQTMVQSNLDKVAHNANVLLFSNSPSGLTIPVNGPIKTRYSEEEPIPCPIRCNIHDWMQAYVLIRANPYMAKTDKDGRFEIKHLPFGSHTFRFWHERAGYLGNVTLGMQTTDAKGRLTVTVNQPTINLAQARLAPAIFTIK